MSVYAALAYVLIFCACVVRVWSFPVITTDYTYFVAKWFVTLQENPGLTAFLHPFADYAPAYLYILKILTWFPVYSLLSVKIVTFVCDAALGYVVYKLLKATTTYLHEQRLLASAIVFAAPSFLINSSLWGQSDVLYTLPILLSFFALLLELPLFAVIWFGVALSVKLQAVFFLPILIGFLWHRRRLYELVLVPLIYMAFAVPALVGGAASSDVLMVYLHQSGEYTSLNVSSQSLFAFTDGVQLTSQVQAVLFWCGISVALLVALLGAWLVTHAKKPYEYVHSALVVALLLPFFLPRMHERYFYLADLFALLYAFYQPRQWFVPLVVIGASLLAYMPFLSGQVAIFAPITIDLRVPATMLGIVGVYLVARSASQWRLHAVP
ncbi:MAG: hypothetical protein QG621_401 [Patescibacteria group bacterium]|nr:hypothetical protein [Patescibacteria group bacterium]